MQWIVVVGSSIWPVMIQYQYVTPIICCGQSTSGVAERAYIISLSQNLVSELLQLSALQFLTVLIACFDCRSNWIETGSHHIWVSKSFCMLLSVAWAGPSAPESLASN